MSLIVQLGVPGSEVHHVPATVSVRLVGTATMSRQEMMNRGVAGL